MINIKTNINQDIRMNMGTKSQWIVKRTEVPFIKVWTMIKIKKVFIIFLYF